MTDVAWPWKRQELRGYLRELADPGFRDVSNFDIDFTFHFFFDDTDLAEKPHSEIGRILKDAGEAEEIGSLCRSLDAMLKRLGDVQSNVFLRDREWLSIQMLAKAALDSVEKNGGADTTESDQP
jgi:hypothetical protein